MAHIIPVAEFIMFQKGIGLISGSSCDCSVPYAYNTLVGLFGLRCGGIKIIIIVFVLVLAVSKYTCLSSVPLMND